MSQLPDNRVSRSANAEDGGSLQKIQTLLEETQQLTKVGGWEFDIANGQLTWTNEVYRIYGVDPETYNPNDIDRDITFYDPKDQAVIIAAFHRAVEHGHSYDLELCFPDDDGIEKWVRTIGVAEEIDGRVTRVFGNIMDITERKRAEEELRRTYAFTQDILDTAQTIILVLDAEGRIESFNPYMEKISGYCLAEVRGKEWIPTFLPERDHARLRGILHEALGDVLISGNVNAIVTKTGEERLIEWHCRTLKSASNQTTGVLSIGQDVTNRARSESDIHDARHFLDAVVDMSPFPMWVSDPEGIVIRTNRALRETLGIADKDIVGRYNVLKDTNLEMQGVMPLVKAVFEEFKPARFSMPWHAADAGDSALSGGNDLYIDVSMFPVLDTTGALASVVCQWVDITKRKRAEEQMAEQLEELRRWHELTLGRETRVIELKREVNALLDKAGQPPRYELGTGREDV